MRACISTFIACLLAAGCTDADHESAGEQQGRIELRIDPAPALSEGITRVTLEAETTMRELPLNPATGTFDGALLLAPGPHSLIARAFSGDALVGESRPTAVDVQTGVVTRVLIKILDLTGETSLYGPIIDSLQFPTTAEAGASVDFAFTVVSPSDSPVTYAWSSDCSDSTFGTPAAATTRWSKPAEGTCQIHVAATSNGFTVNSAFAIAVFPPGSATGAVDASGQFVSAPVIVFGLEDLQCSVGFGGNASCATTIASPAITQFSAFVATWGGATPGTLDVSDNCGGRFTFDRSFDAIIGHWLPPVEPRLCILTARAVNSEGVAGTAAPAILVHRGTPPMTTPPLITVQFFGLVCSFDSSSPQPVDCGATFAGSSVFLSANLTFGDGIPGPGAFSDDCGGGMFALGSNLAGFGFGWTTPSEPGRVCTATIHSTNAQGGESTASALYRLQ